MYCRNVYMRTGLRMPTDGWVIDLGANSGLFSVWAALNGANVVAVEAQAGFAPVISALAMHNGVADRVHVEVALASGAATSGTLIGVASDDRRWSASSHGRPMRPTAESVPKFMSKYGIQRIGLLKVDIEGGEFAVFAANEELSWLQQVDQVVLELHETFGNVPALVDRLRRQNFHIDLRDNNDAKVIAASGQVDYAYCKR